MNDRMKLIARGMAFVLTAWAVGIVPVRAAPGTLAQVPLFVGLDVQPNIFFGLDDSGSMNWSMPHQGAESAYFTEIVKYYDIVPDDGHEWRTWCLGANLLAYNSALQYPAWPGNIPGTSDPFPPMTPSVTSDYTRVWVSPRTGGAGGFKGDSGPIYGYDTGTADLREAPVVTWTDTNGNGVYDPGECPTSYSDSRVKKFSELSAAEKENFANWFAYFRTREFTTKAAVGYVVAQSSARMGLATLHRNNSVGVPIDDMRVDANKLELLENLYNIKSSGGTPLRGFLDDIGKYFSTEYAIPDRLFGSGVGGGGGVQQCRDACDDAYDDAVDACDEARNDCRDQCSDERRQCRNDCDDVRAACRSDCDATYQSCKNACPSGKAGKQCRKQCDRDRKQCRRTCNSERNSCRSQCDTDRQTCNEQCDVQHDSCVDEAADDRTACYASCTGTDTGNSPIFSAGHGGECQQNFVLLMTDGAWNGSSPNVGHQDKDLDIPYVYEAHRDSYSNTLADVAMRWYKTDLAPAIAGEVPTQSGDPGANLDENSEQHLVTFTVAFGPTGTLTTDPSDRNVQFPWPEPTANSQETADDLRHAAYNGRGKFLSAKDPVSLFNQLNAIIADIESRQGSAAAVDFNSATLEAGTQVFVALFSNDDWSGDLLAYDLDPDTGNLSPQPAWSAAQVLDARPSVSTRVVYTLGASGDGALLTATNVGGSTTWPTTTRADFRTEPDATQEASPYSNSAKRVDFIRGDRTNEGSLFRERGSRLGDFVHSPPTFVGGAVSSWPDADPFGDSANRYSGFVNALKGSPRTSMVYAGANDGLFHGFRATDGAELMAYAPAAVASDQASLGFHYLTEKTYGHRYYVDGGIAVADVFIPTVANGPRSWRTIAVGALRGGGRGLFALDVTDPSSFSNTSAGAESTVLWEFTSDDEPSLGFTFSAPQVAMMHNGKWAVVLGNGYNDAGSDGTAKLLILFIEDGLDGWAAGDYILIDTQSGDATNRNGLSTPALLDLDGDQVIDRIYAGDLHGDLWVFDVSADDPAAWDVAYLDAALMPPTKLPLFDGDPAQPITMKPLLLRPDWVSTTGDNTPNVMVYFGTGQYLAQGDASTTTQQYFYGVWDAGQSQLTRTDLVEQTTQVDAAIPATARVLSDNPVSYASPPSEGDLGWFYSLPESGERVVVDAFARQGLIFFNTAIPNASACTAGGYSFLMSVKADTGGNPDDAAFDFNADGKVDDDDLLDLIGGSGKAPKRVAVAGQKFDQGLASASAVLGDYQYTTGTETPTPVKRLLRPAASAPTTGIRRSWIELTPQ